MKRHIFAILLLCMEASLYAQTFEADNFRYRINPDGSASWMGMTTIGSESKGFFWQEGKNPIIKINGRPDDTRFAYHKTKKDFKIPESIKHNGKKYLVTSIDVEDNYFFRSLDEQKRMVLCLGSAICQFKYLHPLRRFQSGCGHCIMKDYGLYLRNHKIDMLRWGIA